MSADHGHPLWFGAVLPADEPERALLSEELGYDLVTFRDTPGSLDPWTLLSWVAGRTSRVQLVAAVPAGPVPAVTGRAAAGLDLLSGGRVTLLLAEDGEAIDVIRGVWAAGDRSPLFYDGDHYRVAGTERGPAPAHNIPIWIDGSPELAGRKADGWLKDEGTGEALDVAAVAAGREPREVRRLARVTGREPVDELLPMVLDEGVSTFLMEADDPGTLRRFATDVAPALRAAVARERLTRGTHEPATIPSTFVRRHRRDGIDYDGIPASLARTAIEPGDAGYARVRSTYLRGGSPGLVLRPGTPGEVSEAVRFAAAQPVKLSIRSGGHGISGRSTNNGGIVIDVSRLNAIEILDKAARRVRIEPGARWTDVAAALAPHGWALTSGDYGGVGVGGLATSGGIGWLAREHGLTIDHLRAVELVLADGSHVRADESENAELFWGVRGAGANFGIVTSFEFEVDEVGPVGFARFAVDATDTAGFLERWGAALEAAPREVTSSLIIGQPRPGQPLLAQVMTVVDTDDAETIIDRLQPLAAAAPLLDYSIQVVPYEAIMNVPQGAHDAQGEPVTRSALADHLTPELATDVARLVASGQTYFFQIRAVGGAVADVPPDATPYAGRAANFQLVAFGPSRRGLDQAWDGMRRHFSGLYINFETDPRPERLHDAYPDATLQRLRALKRRYDPGNVFRDNFNITPS